MSSQSVIETKGLSKSYGDLKALHNIDFSVQAGSIFCMLGPNGAGKTTLTEILEGHTTLDEGSVSVLGFDPAKRPREFREKIGVVLQETSVQENFSVLELLKMYSFYYPQKTDINIILKQVGLEEKTKALPSELSGGQKRRLDLALALVGDPELVFLDEPTTGFDPKARRETWGMLKDLSNGGKTIFLTTHFMDEAQALADTVAVCKKGEIIAQGTPEEIGGRNRLATHISFSLPSNQHHLPTFSNTEILQNENNHFVLSTTSSLKTINHLSGWAIEKKIELQNINVSQPSLEDVYINLVGDQ